MWQNSQETEEVLNEKTSFFVQWRYFVTDQLFILKIVFIICFYLSFH